MNLLVKISVIAKSKATKQCRNASFDPDFPKGLAMLVQARCFDLYLSFVLIISRWTTIRIIQNIQDFLHPAFCVVEITCHDPNWPINEIEINCGLAVGRNPRGEFHEIVHPGCVKILGAAR